MRAFFFIVLILAGQLVLLGQSAEDEVIRLKQSAEMGELQEDQSGSETEAPKADQNLGSWNTSVGTSFSYMKGYGSGMHFFAAPTYTLPLTNRWSLHGGLVASHFTGFNTPGTGEFEDLGTYSSLAVFGAASYRMNERLILHGSGVKQLVTAPTSPFTPYPTDKISLGATYRIGHNISIGASLSINQGRGYYGNAPLFGSPMHSVPFNNVPFMSPFGW